MGRKSSCLKSWNLTIYLKVITLTKDTIGWLSVLTCQGSVALENQANRSKAQSLGLSFVLRTSCTHSVFTYIYLKEIPE